MGKAVEAVEPAKEEVATGAEAKLWGLGRSAPGGGGYSSPPSPMASRVCCRSFHAAPLMGVTVEPWSGPLMLLLLLQTSSATRLQLRGAVLVASHDPPHQKPGDSHIASSLSSASHSLSARADY